MDSMYTPLSIDGFSLNPGGMQVLLDSQLPTSVVQSEPIEPSPLHSKVLWAVAGAGVLLLWATQNAH